MTTNDKTNNKIKQKALITTKIRKYFWKENIKKSKPHYIKPLHNKLTCISTKKNTELVFSENIKKSKNKRGQSFKKRSKHTFRCI